MIFTRPSSHLHRYSMALCLRLANSKTACCDALSLSLGVSISLLDEFSFPVSWTLISIVNKLKAGLIWALVFLYPQLIVFNGAS